MATARLTTAQENQWPIPRHGVLDWTKRFCVCCNLTTFCRCDFVKIFFLVWKEMRLYRKDYFTAKNQTVWWYQKIYFVYGVGIFSCYSNRIKINRKNTSGNRSCLYFPTLLVKTHFHLQQVRRHVIAIRKTRHLGPKLWNSKCRCVCNQNEEIITIRRSVLVKSGIPQSMLFFWNS